MTPYQTQNGALAVALSLGKGVKFWTNPEDGLLQPTYNIYDRDILARLGYKGWQLEAAAENAWKAGKPGLIIYNFEKCETLERMVTAWLKQEELIKKLDEDKDTVFSNDSVDVEIEPEELAQILCQYAKNRKSTMAMWKVAPPLIRITGDTKSHTEGDKVITVGSLKAYSINLSKERRAHLGIK